MVGCEKRMALTQGFKYLGWGLKIKKRSFKIEYSAVGDAKVMGFFLVLHT